MPDIQFVTELQLDHDELMAVLAALLSAVPNQSFSDSFNSAFMARKGIEILGRERIVKVLQKFHAYHEYLHLLDPSLDDHNDN